MISIRFLTSEKNVRPLEVAIVSLSGMLALSERLKTRQKAVLHEACHSSPLAGLAAGLSCQHRGCTCQSFFEVTIQYELVVAASKLLAIFPRKIT
jgi:hypothetical protein